MPKKEYSSVKLAILIKEGTGVDIQQPQVRREALKPFYSACVRIDNPEHFEKVKNKMRYFKLEGKDCRALPYDQDFLGVNLPKLQEQNIFIRKIDKKVTSEDLEKKFLNFGGVKSCKVSVDEEYKSRGYGFVCFSDAEYCKAALE